MYIYIYIYIYIYLFNYTHTYAFCSGDSISFDAYPRKPSQSSLQSQGSLASPRFRVREACNFELPQKQNAQGSSARGRAAVGEHTNGVLPHWQLWNRLLGLAWTSQNLNNLNARFLYPRQWPRGLAIYATGSLSLEQCSEHLGSPAGSGWCMKGHAHRYSSATRGDCC